MENHGIEMIGPLLLEKVSTLPTWTAADESRFFYAEDEKKLYYGDDTEWQESAALSLLKKYGAV
jgi:hypothetical protein